MKKIILVAALGLMTMSFFSFAPTQKFDLKASVERGKEVYTAQCITCHLEQGEGICATFWTLTTDPIDQGERIDAVWAAVVLTNSWTAVLAAPSDIPFNSPGFTIDAPWPLDTYGYVRRLYFVTLLT